MATIFGKTYTKAELLNWMGNLGTVAGIRQIAYQDGFAQGLRAYEITNGNLRFTVHMDKTMDVGEVYYKGIPIHFQSRPGLMSHRHFADGENAGRSIMGGMMFTCGLQNVGPGENGQPPHGFIRNTPAQLHGARTYWQGDDCFMEVTGTMREGALFGTNLVLRRTITTKLGDTTISIRDEIENESATPDVPMMLLYHCNVGFPVLDDQATLKIDAISTTPRDEAAAKGATAQSPLEFGVPVVGDQEQVFYHDLKSVDNRATATVLSPSQGLQVAFAFDTKELPNFTQWKCRDAGNYVMGIEPGNCRPEGLTREIERGTCRLLAPHETVKTALDITIQPIL